MYYKLYFISCIVLLFQACSETSEQKITDTADYNTYLDFSENTNYNTAKKSSEFWLKKLKSNPDGHAYMVKAASAYARMFSASGVIEYLKLSEEQLLKANRRTKYKNPGYLKSLAHNYISQHRFGEALSLLKKAENFQEGIIGTRKMLYDVHLELGDYVTAKTYLNQIENFTDFDYLIRLAKWNDHKGNLDEAVDYMEIALARAESRNLNGLKQWSYTNIADFYGHAGKIEKSYHYFLKALEINPYDAYAKKGIAWIIYSHEKNPSEALRILNSVTENYQAPEYHLLKAEIAEYQSNQTMMKVEIDLYQDAIKNGIYGDMYNKYNVLIYAEDPLRAKEALKIAKNEVDNRPTPQSYDLLAWAHYKNGNLEKALKIAEANVIDKTFEPEALYHVAEIYKAKAKNQKSELLKKELLSSVYELGPIMASKIEKL